MKQQITLAQYRTVDLLILTGVLAACQTLIHMAVRFWFPEQLFIVSPVAGMTALVMMRWDWYGAIPAVVGGLLYTRLAGGTAQQYLIYGLGNLSALGAMFLLKAMGKEKTRLDSFRALVFALCTQLLMQLGRAGLALALGYSGEACLGFLTTDALSILFTMFLVWTARRVDGLFEDQKHYLLRIQAEQAR